MREAAVDYLWLLNRQYPQNATLKLVGDRYRLHQRQRSAIARSICSDEQKRIIVQKLQQELLAQDVFIDGFNLIITMEAMVCKAPVLICRDHALRDLSGVHGSYHKVTETPEVVQIIAEAMQQLKPASITWLFDRPVSNSGRLARLVKTIGDQAGVNWECYTSDRTDQQLLEKRGTLITSDSGILIHCSKWFSLTSYIKEQGLIEGWFINLNAK